VPGPCAAFPAAEHCDYSGGGRKCNRRSSWQFTGSFPNYGNDGRFTRPPEFFTFASLAGLL
jgi:hypothetical protein